MKFVWLRGLFFFSKLAKKVSFLLLSYNAYKKNTHTQLKAIQREKFSNPIFTRKIYKKQFQIGELVRKMSTKNFFVRFNFLSSFKDNLDMKFISISIKNNNKTQKLSNYYFRSYPPSQARLIFAKPKSVAIIIIIVVVVVNVHIIFKRR